MSCRVTRTEKIHMPRVRYAYRSIYVTHHPFKQLVGQDAGGVIETEQTMICKDGSDPHVMGMHDALVCKG